MGAFMALPVAALVTSLASTYLESHEIVDRSGYEEAAVDERDDEAWGGGTAPRRSVMSR